MRISVVLKEKRMEEAKAGKIDFKTDDSSDIKVGIAKADFEFEDFKKNLK